MRWARRAWGSSGRTRGLLGFGALASSLALSQSSLSHALDLGWRGSTRSPELGCFLEYASTERSGETVMTFGDFLASMGIPREVGEKDQEMLNAMFLMADQDGDKVLSFFEYVFFRALLRTPEAKFKLAFKLFDSNGDGSISKEEFFRALSSGHVALDSAHQEMVLAPLELEGLFGEDGSKKMRYEEFCGFMKSLKRLFLNLEFKKYPLQDGRIKKEDFAKLLRTYHSGSGSNYHGLNLWLRGEALPKGSFSFDEFLFYVEFLDDLPEIHSACDIYTAAGAKMSRTEFLRCMKILTERDFTSGEVDLVFDILAGGEAEISQQSLTRFLDPENSKTKMNVTQSLAIAGVSACIGATTVFPIDKIKTLIQSSTSNENVMRQMQSQFKLIVSREGFRGLYRGLLPQIIGIMPEKALKLTINDRLRKKLRGNANRELFLWEEIAAGMGTGIFQVFVTNPYELVKIRVQIQAATGVKKSLGQVVKNTGFTGLYKGLPATMLRDIPFNMIYFSAYATFKSILKDKHGVVSGWGLLLAGGGAGILAAALDTPADTIKTQLQNDSGKYRNVRHAITTIAKEEGLNGFFKGVVPRMLIIAPLFSVTFYFYELFQRLLFPKKESGFEMIDDATTEVRKFRIKKTVQELSKFGIAL